jgi:hypothetical protein
MLAHGDSWFDYPLAGNSVSLPHTDIIVQLESMGNVNPYILNMSQWGDATTDEMSLPKQQLMISALQDPSNWLSAGKPDAILFSGGGNDVAGDQFCIFLDYSTLSPNGLDVTRFQDALGMVEASYITSICLHFATVMRPAFPFSLTATTFRSRTGRIPCARGHGSNLPSISADTI